MTTRPDPCMSPVDHKSRSMYVTRRPQVQIHVCQRRPQVQIHVCHRRPQVQIHVCHPSTTSPDPCMSPVDHKFRSMYVTRRPQVQIHVCHPSTKSPDPCMSPVVMSFCKHQNIVQVVSNVVLIVISGILMYLRD